MASSEDSIMPSEEDIVSGSVRSVKRRVYYNRYMFDSNEKIPRTTALRWKKAEAADAAVALIEQRYDLVSGADSDNDNDISDDMRSDDEDDDDLYYNAESDVESDDP